jgi:hypothetical protein
MTKAMQTHEVGGHLASLSLIGKFHRRHRVYELCRARTKVPVELGNRLLFRLFHAALLHGERNVQSWTSLLRFCSRRPVGGPAAVECGATSSSLPDERSRRNGLTVTPGSFNLPRIIRGLRAMPEWIAGDSRKRLERAPIGARPEQDAYGRRALTHRLLAPGAGGAPGDRR